MPCLLHAGHLLGLRFDRHYVPPKYHLTFTRLHIVTPQKKEIFIIIIYLDADVAFCVGNDISLEKNRFN
jgi:hypothetical protein